MKKIHHFIPIPKVFGAGLCSERQVVNYLSCGGGCGETAPTPTTHCISSMPCHSENLPKVFGHSVPQLHSNTCHWYAAPAARNLLNLLGQ